jgi:hypothetical protein
MEFDQTKSSPPRRVAHFLWQTTASQTITVLVTLAITGGVAFLSGRLTAASSPPGIEVQLADMRATAIRHHEQIFVRPASLHGGLSYVIVREPLTEYSAALGPSGGVEIYDVDHGRLKPMFHFKPAPNGRERWRYRLDGAQDLEGTGKQEVIGGFSLLIDSGGTRAFIPTIITWDDATSRYVIEALLNQTPLEQVDRLRFHEFVGVGGAIWWAVESEGLTLRDFETGAKIHGYGGAGYIVNTVSSFRAPSTTGLVVVAVIGSIHDDTPVAEISGWILNPTLPKVTEANCPARHNMLRLVYGDVEARIARAYGNSGDEC